MKKNLVPFVLSLAMFAGQAHCEMLDKPSDALFHRDEGRFAALLKQGAKANGWMHTDDGDNGNPYLLYAAYHDLAATVTLLLDAGADPLVVNREGQNALHLAALSHAWKALPVLLKSPAVKGVNATDKSGWTPLLYACTGDTGIIKALVAAGADVNLGSKDRYHLSPLVRAADRGRPDAVATLIALKADVKGKAGADAIAAAATYDTGKHAEAILLLAKAGADPDSPAIWKTLEYKRAKCLEALLQGGANVNARTSPDPASRDGATLLIHAVRLDRDAKLVSIILRFHPDLDAVQKSRMIFSGVNLSTPPRPPEDHTIHRTALMCAAEAGDLEIVKLLIGAGANPAIRDTESRTALDLARERKHPAVAAYLENVRQ